MDELLQQFAADPLGRLVVQYVAAGGLWNAYVLLLVAARLVGLLLISPCFQPNAIPISVRVGLVVLMSLIIAPTLSDTTTPDVLIPVAHDASASNRLPETVVDLVCLIASETGLGTMFGIGVIAVFSGLKLGAEWLERHGGLGMGTVLNPEWTNGASPLGSLITMSAVAAFLVLEPIGGQRLLFQALAHSFRAIPVGCVQWSTSAVELVSQIVQQSLLLGIRIAMPLVATMMLIDAALSFCSRGGPLVIGASQLPIRIGIGAVVLAISTSTVSDVVAKTILSVLGLVASGR